MRGHGIPPQVVLCAVLLGAPAPLASADDVPLTDLVFVTDAQEDWYADGCYCISAIDARSGGGIAYSQHVQTTGRIAVASDASIVVATTSSALVTLARSPSAPTGWRSEIIGSVEGDGRRAIAMSPDDQVLLFAVGTGMAITKHRVAEARAGRMAPPIGSVSVERGPVADIVFDGDARTAYVVTAGGEVRVLDAETMTFLPVVIPIQPLLASLTYRIRNTFSSLSPDGRYLVVNTGGSDINVVDLVAGTSWLVAASGLQRTMELAFDYARPVPPRLAVHGYTKVAVYAFEPHALQALAAMGVPAQVPCEPHAEDGQVRLGTLAWLARGDGIVAAIGGKKEYRILDLGEDGLLRRRLDFDACTRSVESTMGLQWDVGTTNQIALVPRPTPAATVTATTTDAPTPTPTPPPPATCTPTASATAIPSSTPTRTPTPTASATATPTSTSTPVPQPLYLPLALRERCPAGKQHVDVALVIDVSTTMRDDRTAAGRTKLEAAVEAAGAFVDVLALPLDQAAVVGFNASAWVEQPLTGRRPEVEAALARIPDGVREQTRIDLGIEEAHRELLGPRRLAGNRPVMIVLTDGLANPEPASTAVQRAAEAKADDITIFTIGLGHEGELNVPELTQMATRPEYFHHAPDAEDLAAIYRGIAVALPCPGVRLWPGARLTTTAERLRP